MLRIADKYSKLRSIVLNSRTDNSNGVSISYK